MLEKPGALMLEPVYKLLFGRCDFTDEPADSSSTGHYLASHGPSLELIEDWISITYKTYRSDNLDDMQTLMDQNLAPGKHLVTGG